MARRSGGTAEDGMEGENIPRQQSEAERRAAGAAMAQNVRDNEARENEPNFLEQAGGFIFGNGKDPGLLGTGQYEVQGAEVNTDAGRLPNAQGTRNRIAGGLQEVSGRDAPTMDTARGDQFRDQQMELAGDLLAQSRGEGPSVAQEQLRQGLQNNVASTVAAANTIRGPGGAAQAGQLMASRAMLGQQAASDAAVLRAQEITQARGQLAQVTAQGRGQDLETAGQNQQAELETQRQKDGMVQYYLSLGFSVDQAEQQANMRMEELRTNAHLEEERLRAGAYADVAQRRGQMVRDVAAGAAQVAGIGAGGAPKA